MADRIPTPAEIATLSDAELRLLAQRLGVTDAHVARVTEAVRRATSRLVGANLPSQALQQKVREATLRAVRSEMQVITRELIRERARIENEVTDDTLERWQYEEGADHCEDCLARHGHVQTHAEWVVDGLPGTGNTVCGKYCKCDLVPEEAFTGPYERGDVQVTVDLEVA